MKTNNSKDKGEGARKFKKNKVTGFDWDAQRPEHLAILIQVSIHLNSVDAYLCSVGVLPRLP
jgi:hypothetical protein